MNHSVFWWSIFQLSMDGMGQCHKGIMWTILHLQIIQELFLETIQKLEGCENECQFIEMTGEMSLLFIASSLTSHWYNCVVLYLFQSMVMCNILCDLRKKGTPIGHSLFWDWDLRLQFCCVYALSNLKIDIRVDSRDPHTFNIPIWRYHCLGEVVFLKIWNQYWLPSDSVHKRFLFISPAHLQTSSTGPLNRL